MTLQIDSGLANPAVPAGVFILAGAAAGVGLSAASSITEWLKQPNWSTGEYNAWLRTMHDTILAWNALGWKSGCWNDANLRKQWVAYMDRFAKHYKDHGTVSWYVSDADEYPVRNVLMPELAAWGTLLNKTCGAQVQADSLIKEQGRLKAEGDAASAFDWNAAFRWGAIGILGLIGLQVISSAKTALR